MPNFDKEDFDWVPTADPTKYTATLNERGISKLLSENPDVELRPTSGPTAPEAPPVAPQPVRQPVAGQIAKIGEVIKHYDGTTVLPDVPNVSLRQDLVQPSFAVSDFTVRARAGSVGDYTLVLNESGLTKLQSANPEVLVVASGIRPGQLQIIPAVVTVTAKATGKKVGAPDPTFMAIIKDKPTTGNDLAFTLTRTPGEHPGIYALRVVTEADANANYTIETAPAQFIISDAYQEGDADTPKVGMLGMGFKPFDGTNQLTPKELPQLRLIGLKNPELTPADFDLSQVRAATGVYVVSLNRSGLQKLNRANPGKTITAQQIQAGVVKIKKSLLKVTIKTRTQTYNGRVDQVVPEVAVAYVDGRHANAPLGLTVDDFDWEATSPAVGKYKITLKASGIEKINLANLGAELKADNVDFGLLQITEPEVERHITVTATSKPFDDSAAVPLSALTVTGEHVTIPPLTEADYDFSAVQAAVGEYPVTLSDAGLTTIAAANDGLPLTRAMVTAGTFTITEPAATITIAPLKQTYDGTVQRAVPQVTVTSTLTDEKGVVPSDLTAEDFDWTEVQPGVSGPAGYALPLTTAGLKKFQAANPDLTFDETAVAGLVTIMPAPVSVTVPALSKGAGEPDPDLTAKATVSGVPPSGVAFDYTITRDPGEATGSYPMHVEQGHNPNYTLSYNLGTFTINAAVTKAQASVPPAKPQAGAQPTQTQAPTQTKSPAPTQNDTTQTAPAEKATPPSTAPAPKPPAVIYANLGSVEKAYDGEGLTAAIVPGIGVDPRVQTPTLTLGDFDLSAVQAAVGTYPLQLNAQGLGKLRAVYGEASITREQVRAGVLTITPAKTSTPSLKVNVGTNWKAYDGSSRIENDELPLLGLIAGWQNVPLTTSTFNLRQVKAEAGTYPVTLNQEGVNALLAANPGESLTLNEVGTGSIIVKKSPLTAQVEDATRTLPAQQAQAPLPVTLFYSPHPGERLPALQPQWTSADFDWAQVQSQPGRYPVTLSTAGVAKVQAANPNNELTAAGVVAGWLTITKEAAPIANPAPVAPQPVAGDPLATLNSLPKRD